MKNTRKKSMNRQEQIELAKYYQKIIDENGKLAKKLNPYQITDERLWTEREVFLLELAGSTTHHCALLHDLRLDMIRCH